MRNRAYEKIKSQLAWATLVQVIVIAIGSFAKAQTADPDTGFHTDDPVLRRIRPRTAPSIASARSYRRSVPMVTVGTGVQGVQSSHSASGVRAVIEMTFSGIREGGSPFIEHRALELRTRLGAGALTHDGEGLSNFSIEARPYTASISLDIGAPEDSSARFHDTDVIRIGTGTTEFDREIALNVHERVRISLTELSLGVDRDSTPLDTRVQAYGRFFLNVAGMLWERAVNDGSLTDGLAFRMYGARLNFGIFAAIARGWTVDWTIIDTRMDLNAGGDMSRINADARSELRIQFRDLPNGIRYSAFLRAEAGVRSTVLQEINPVDAFVSGLAGFEIAFD